MVHCARYEIDVIGGDANAGIYRYLKKQRVPNFRMSSLSCMFNRLIEKIRHWKTVLGFTEKQALCHYQFVTSNRVKETQMEQIIKGDEHVCVDCIFWSALSWGHSLG